VSGAEIADRFEAANEAAIDYILGPAAGAWDATTPDESWPVGVTARHIALGHDLMAGWAESIKARTPLFGPDIHSVNAEIAAQGVVATPHEVAELLRDHGKRVAAALRELDDDDLAQEVKLGPNELPARRVAEAALRHVEAHLSSIKAACGDA
jgi:hypothetical protein